MRSERAGATIVCMQTTNGKPRRFSRRRRLGEQAVQSLAITSQMALLYPPGIDEWMRRELGGEAGGRTNDLTRVSSGP
jgi:hypothetical protein